ncbi:TPA: SGNH/GDSL hydrolase family protein [Bacillus pacificus]|nr:SGNH/GDSL hydrolase family protein [Bacillus pacificus]
MPMLPEELLTESDLLPDGVSKINKGIKKAHDAYEKSNEPITVGKLASNSVSTDKIIDNSVTGSKTDFLEQTSNLFNKAEVIYGKYYSGKTLVSNSSYNSTGITKVTPNGRYFFNSYGYYSVTFFDENKEYVSALGANSWSGSFIVPSNAHYVAIAFAANDSVDKLMLSKDKMPSEYVEFGYVLDHKKVGFSQVTKDSLVMDKDLEYGGMGKNLFNKEKITQGYEVYGDGSLKKESNSMISDYILVKGLDNIYISGLTKYESGFERYCYFYDNYKNPIGTKLGLSNSLIEGRFPVPQNAAYFVMSIYQRKTSSETINLDTIQIEKGMNKTSYEPYKQGIIQIKGYELAIPSSSVESSPVKTKGKNLLAFGDSITETATVSDDGSDYKEGTRSNWPAFTKYDLQVSQMWNYAKSGATYKDREINGTTVVPRQMISTQINTAIANNRPGDIIVVSMGTNDGASNLGSYETAMSKTTLDDLDRTKLYEAIRWAFWKIRTHYPNAFCYASTPIQRVSNEQPQELLDAITKMAKRYNFIIIDAHNESGVVRDFEVPNGQGRYLYDGLHPNTKGQELMAKLYSRVVLNTFR